MKIDFEKIFGRLFIILCSTIVTLWVVDRVSLKFLIPQKTAVEQQFEGKDIRKPYPYIMFKGAPFGKAWKRYSKKTGLTDNILNELGYQGEVPVMPKPENEYRIVVLGGSTVFKGNPPLPRLIQYQFEKKGCHDVKVYNFGVVSSVTSMELARIIFEVVNYDVDLIISYSGFNDIDQPFAADPRPGYPYNYFIYESNPILESHIRDYPLVPLMAYGSNLMRYFFPSYFIKEFTDLDKIRDEHGYRSPQWKEQIVDSYIDNILKSHKIAKAFGADFMAFFQPSLYFKQHIHESEKGFLSQERMASSRELRGMIQERAKTLMQQEGVAFFDVSGLFDKTKEKMFTDRVHLDHRSRPMIAEGLYPYISTFMQDNNVKGLSNGGCLQ